MFDYALVLMKSSFISQINCYLLLGDIYLQQDDYESALDNYNEAIDIDQHNVEGLKGVLTCNYQLDLFDETWDLLDGLSFAEIKDPMVFIGFYQIGYACIEALTVNEAIPEESNEVRTIENKCNSLLNYASALTDCKNIELRNTIAQYYFDIKNYQNVYL